MSAREHIVPIFVPHLGCPHDCVFCNQRRITGQQRPAEGKDVRRSVEEALRASPASGALQLAFYGGSFTAIPEREQTGLLEAAQPFLSSGAIRSIRLSTRPDAIDGPTLERLKAYGVETVELGAQSLDDEVLRRAGRGHSAEDVRRASRLVQSFGFRLILQMMTGLPGDSGGESLRTAEEICRLKPDGVRIYPTVIVRDTALYELWKAGKYREHTVEDAVTLCAQIVPEFEKAGIPVIRLGLNPTEELSAGAAAGGAYHPALGELVKSRMLRNRAEALLQGTEPGKSAVIRVPPRLLSQMLGQRRCNLGWLKERFSLTELKILPDETVSGMKIEGLSIEK